MEIDTKYWDKLFSKNFGCLSLNEFVACSDVVEVFLPELQQVKNGRMRTRWSKSSLYWQTKKSFKIENCLKEVSGIFGPTDSNTRSMFENWCVVRLSTGLETSIETLFPEQSCKIWEDLVEISDCSVNVAMFCSRWLWVFACRQRVWKGLIEFSLLSLQLSLTTTTGQIKQEFLEYYYESENWMEISWMHFLGPTVPQVTISNEGLKTRGSESDIVFH